MESQLKIEVEVGDEIIRSGIEMEDGKTYLRLRVKLEMEQGIVLLDESRGTDGRWNYSNE